MLCVRWWSDAGQGQVLASTLPRAQNRRQKVRPYYEDVQFAHLVILVLYGEGGDQQDLFLSHVFGPMTQSSDLPLFRFEQFYFYSKPSYDSKPL